MNVLKAKLLQAVPNKHAKSRYSLLHWCKFGIVPTSLSAWIRFTALEREVECGPTLVVSEGRICYLSSLYNKAFPNGASRDLEELKFKLLISAHKWVICCHCCLQEGYNQWQ